MNEASALRIAVLGCGRIGSAFAFQLARAGHDVTVVARPASTRLEQLRRDGAIVQVSGDRATVHVAEALDQQVAYDLVIVTVLAHQAAGLAPALQASRAASILLMFNTFEPERIVTAMGGERCAFGMPFVQASLDKNGRLAATIGYGGQKTLLGEQRWVELFQGAGLPAALEANMQLWLRCHAPMCVAFESVSIAAVRRGGAASWREAWTLARGVRAGFKLIRALGFPIYPKAKTRLDRAPMPALAFMLWSMSRIRPFRELLATGRIECEALIDVMVDACARAGLPTEASRIGEMRPRP